MGWVFYHRPAGQSDRDHFQAALSEHRTIIDCVTTRGVFYAAVRDDRDNAVSALVCLTRRRRGNYNFGYRDISESPEPAAIDCPDRILDLLSPTDDEGASRWRQACRDRNDDLAGRPKVHPGAIVRFEVPLTFTDGFSMDTFRFESHDRFRAADGTGPGYLIPGWRERRFTVLPDQAAAPGSAVAS